MILNWLEQMQTVVFTVTLADIVIVIALLLPALLVFFALRRRPKHHIATNVSWRRLREAVRQRDNERCYYCGVVTKDGHVDHLTPLSRNGTDHLSNLVWACPSCNTAKGGMTAKEFIKTRQDKETPVELVTETEETVPSPLLSANEEPPPELADLMRQWYAAGVSKNEICRRVWPAKNGVTWAILDRILNA